MSKFIKYQLKAQPQENTLLFDKKNLKNAFPLFFFAIFNYLVIK
ncbi:hypothetical protein EUBDOL_01004 [Amedibacillus dolichus DSM 3991]|uniref:Uncharacterized protein n=1 Tax=Amedibacillus dolichus DSM 3991 TaxID=428127 RepID=A8RB65_9FIRM|nr:hypothetical protein EUBDOL_01004 [Amedibacillus dolichus DSM 3991]